MSLQEPVRLRIFSLNCWGIHYLTRHCSQRYEMIGELLDRQRHDLALLQEVWSEKDYLYLKNKLGSSHPHSHYFRSGVIGSGLAVFSRHLIQDALLYKYSLNGYPYMVHQGDWFGGKAVGLVALDISGLRAHVYVSHLHAEYSREVDSYLPHRTVQAWELQQFIRHTSAGADFLVLGGDLNMHPQDLGCRLVRAHTGLRDCYSDTERFEGCEDGITLIADNMFTTKKDLIPFEKGIRIDYILTKGSKNVCVKCESMSTTTGSVPGKAFPYSDHEALTSNLLLLKPEGGLERHDVPPSELADLVSEALAVVKDGIRHTEQLQQMSQRLLMAGLALLLLELTLALGPCLCPDSLQAFPYIVLGLLGALCLVVLMAGTLLYTLYTSQLKALRETEGQMKLSASWSGHRSQCILPQPSRDDHSIFSH
uniref:sphingomyelin phosphodiesterase n=1 Tax=Denticeps clupeoides TaxID=299321 RepID=A0AAY4CLP9_9TELE